MCLFTIILSNRLLPPLVYFFESFKHKDLLLIKVNRDPTNYLLVVQLLYCNDVMVIT